MDMNGNKIFAVDFDGTLSMGTKWPEIGFPNVELISFLKKQKAAGSRIILYTCRTGEHLIQAEAFCLKYGLTFDAINENLPELVEAYGNDTRKINADFYIDDKNLDLNILNQVIKLSDNI